MCNNELKIEVYGGRVIEAKVMPDGCCVLTVELATVTAEDTTCNQQKGIFKKVPATQLSLNDDFMKYIPKSKGEKAFKNKVIRLIMEGEVRDFWCPVYDPSFDDNGRICYEPGKMPAVGKSYIWWEENAKKYAPERGSRLGTKSEYVAFLAVLIKDLIASGKSVEWAWNAVCCDSKELGHYWNSKDAKHAFETTGSRDICGWYDLANSYKILAENEEAGGFWLAGGYYNDCSYRIPLAGLSPDNSRGKDYGNSCGWLVFDSCPDC